MQGGARRAAASRLRRFAAARGGSPPRFDLFPGPPTMSTIAFSTSVRTPRGRLFVHVAVDALTVLGADPGDPASLLSTFSRHAALLCRLAVARAEVSGGCEVTIVGSDLSASAAG